MFSTLDTIVAIATPPGRGGLGVVRLSGPGAHGIALRLSGRDHPLVPRRATFGRVTEERGGHVLDQVVLTRFAAPASYTGEDVVEISAHGTPAVLTRLVQRAVGLGARVAEPGEFTLRAYLNGRIDLVQAEAVADLVEAVTPAQARAAGDQLAGTLTGAIADVERDLFGLLARLEASLDFPDEGYRFVSPQETAAVVDAAVVRLSDLLHSAEAGRVLREGRTLAIVGRPNAGKSSIFNALLGFDRAIVNQRPGTTRDVISHPCIVHGVPLTLADTAGWRAARTSVERDGIRRSANAAAAADLVLVVLDGSRPLGADDEAVLAETGPSAVLAVNKADLPEAWGLTALGDRAASATRLSARTGAGLEDLRTRLARALVGDDRLLDDVRVTNVRHARLLEVARVALGRATRQAGAAGAEELVVSDLREALGALAEVTGKRAPDAVLREIFSRFCIGK